MVLFITAQESFLYMICVSCFHFSGDIGRYTSTDWDEILTVVRKTKHYAEEVINILSETNHGAFLQYG